MVQLPRMRARLLCCRRNGEAAKRPRCDTARKNAKKSLTSGQRLSIIYERSEDSRWLLAVNPAEDINKILIVFVPLRPGMQRLSL